MACAGTIASRETDAPDYYQTIVIEPSYVPEQSNASDNLGIFPADHQTEVGLHASVEQPNPFPDLSTRNSDFVTKTGFSVSVSSKDDTTLKVVAFTITDAGARAPLSARLLTSANDPAEFLKPNYAFLTTNAPPKPNTGYTVVYSDHINVLVNKNWPFTTTI